MNAKDRIWIGTQLYGIHNKIRIIRKLMGLFQKNDISWMLHHIDYQSLHDALHLLGVDETNNVSDVDLTYLIHKYDEDYLMIREHYDKYIRKRYENTDVGKIFEMLFDDMEWLIDRMIVYDYEEMIRR